MAVVLVRRDTETNDIAALELAAGLLTQRGARTSHAAVVARQLGKVCLVSCTELQIDENARTIKIDGTTLHDGDLLTLAEVRAQRIMELPLDYIPNDVFMRVRSQFTYKFITPFVAQVMNNGVLVIQAEATY